MPHIILTRVLEKCKYKHYYLRLAQTFARGGAMLAPALHGWLQIDLFTVVCGCANICGASHKYSYQKKFAQIFGRFVSRIRIYKHIQL